MKLIKVMIIPRQHNDEVQIVVMRVRADGYSRTECEVHKKDQELAKGHGYQILGRAKNP